MRRIFILLLVLSSSVLYAQKLSVADSLIALLPKANNDTVKIKLYLKIGEQFETTDPEKAIRYYTLALEKSRNASLAVPKDKPDYYKKFTAKANDYIGFVCYITGDFVNALVFYQEAVRLFYELGNKKSLSICLNSMGAVFADMGNFSQAIEYYQKSLRIREATGDQAGISKCLNNIGGLYHDQKNYPKAIDYYSRSLKIKKSLDDKSTLPGTLNNLGSAYFESGDYKTALSYYDQSLKLSRELGALEDIAACYNNIGSIYLAKREFDSAMVQFDAALVLYDSLGDQKSQSVCLNNIGSVLHEKGQYKKAIEFSMKALALAKNAGARYELMNIYKSLSQSCEKNKDYTNAFGYLSNYISLHDTLYNEENSRKLAQTEMQYEFDKKQQQRIFEEKQREIARQAELKRQRIFLYSALGGLVLMLLLAFYMYRSYQIKKKANKILAAQKAEIEDKNRQIMDSIRYARKIQNAILPSDAFIDSVLEDNFVLFRPKEMVSGDFYWVEKKDNKILFASVDCTGHGVPGALMSIVGHNILSQAINEKKLTDAGSILNHLSSELISTLGYSGSGDDDVDIRDSMDLALCSLNRDKMVMQFVGVHNPMYIVRNNEVLQFKPHSHPIGAAFTEDFKEYIHEEVPVMIGDLVYLFSDGYVDQVGGPERKKFLSKRFRQTLLEIHHLTMAEQKQKLTEVFESWKGSGEQYDDVLVVGVRI